MNDECCVNDWKESFLRFRDVTERMRGGDGKREINEAREVSVES